MDKPATISFNGTTLDIIHKGLALDHVQLVVFNRFVPIIKKAIEKNKKSCIFCYVGEFSINIVENDYSVVLSLIEDYFVSREDWEQCIILRDLKTIIDEKGRPTSRVQ